MDFELKIAREARLANFSKLQSAFFLRIENPNLTGLNRHSIDWLNSSNSLTAEGIKEWPCDDSYKVPWPWWYAAYEQGILLQI